MPLKSPKGIMHMQQANPSGQATQPEKQKNVEEERKKLDEDLKLGKISQAEYFKKTQELTGNPSSNPPGNPPMPPQQLPQNPVNPVQPQLPPAPGHAPVKPVSPISPVTPQLTGQREEVPPIGQALAVGSEDIEVVECYKCGGLITVTTAQRPVIIACPTCGTKGEVDATEPELALEPEHAVPKATEGVEIDDQKIFKFDSEPAKSKGPSFGASLDDDLQKQVVKDKAAQTPTVPESKTAPAPQPAVAPASTVEKKKADK